MARAGQQEGDGGDGSGDDDDDDPPGTPRGSGAGSPQPASRLERILEDYALGVDVFRGLFGEFRIPPDDNFTRRVLGAVADDQDVFHGRYGSTAYASPEQAAADYLSVFEAAGPLLGGEGQGVGAALRASRPPGALTILAAARRALGLPTGDVPNPSDVRWWTTMIGSSMRACRQLSQVLRAAIDLQLDLVGLALMGEAIRVLEHMGARREAGSEGPPELISSSDDDAPPPGGDGGGPGGAGRPVIADRKSVV